MALPTPKAGSTHNLVLRYGAVGATTDVGLMLPGRDLRTFTKQAYTPFAPASRQGEATNQDFNVTATWETYNDFSGGIGHLYEKQVQVGDYESAQGVNDADVATIGATLFTAKRKCLLPPVKSVDVGALAVLTKWIEFNGAWYAASNEAAGKIYKYDAAGTTATLVETLTASCTQLYTDGTTLYASQGASYAARSTTDGTTWGNCAYNANVHSLRDESILTYAYGATLVPGTGYPDTVAVGWTGTTINSMVYMNGALFIGKPEGIYTFRNGRVSFVFPVYDQYHANNFKYMVVHHGLLYFAMGGGTNQNSLWYWNGIEGSAPVNLYPDDTSGFDAIYGLFATFGPLLISCKIKDADKTSKSYLLMFDGPEHPGTNPVWSDADGTKPVVGMGATNVHDNSYVRVYISQTGVGERYLDFLPIYEPANFKTESAAAAYSVMTEASQGFRVVQKWYYQIVLNVRKPDSYTFAKVQYSLDDAFSGGNRTWTTTLKADGTTDSAIALSSAAVGTYLPLDTLGLKIKLRVYIWTTSATTAAELSHITIRGITVPKVRYQLAFPVDCSESVVPLSGGEPESGEAIRTHILAAAEQKYPVKICDSDGNWYLAMFRSPSPTVAVQRYENPNENAATRTFTVVNCVLMAVDALGTDGALNSWTAG